MPRLPPPAMRDLARRLLALEAASRTAADAPAHEAARVLDKLRLSLARFAGPEGFASLLRRALALARAEIPALRTVEATPDGSLNGFDQVAADAGSSGTDAALAITAHLLGLLVTFVGEALTLRLVRDAWPDVALNT